MLGQLLADARVGRAGVVAVVGEPGIGKTALLDLTAELAEGMQVLRARGIESEADVPFAGLLELLRPALGALDRVPGPQALALQSALALRPGGASRPLRRRRGDPQPAGRARGGATRAGADRRCPLARHVERRSIAVRLPAPARRPGGGRARRARRPAIAAGRFRSPAPPRRRTRTGPCDRAARPRRRDARQCRGRRATVRGDGRKPAGAVGDRPVGRAAHRHRDRGPGSGLEPDRGGVHRPLGAAAQANTAGDGAGCCSRRGRHDRAGACVRLAGARAHRSASGREARTRPTARRKRRIPPPTCSRGDLQRRPGRRTPRGPSRPCPRASRSGRRPPGVAPCRRGRRPGRGGRRGTARGRPSAPGVAAPTRPLRRRSSARRG